MLQPHIGPVPSGWFDDPGEVRAPLEPIDPPTHGVHVALVDHLPGEVSDPPEPGVRGSAAEPGKGM